MKHTYMIDSKALELTLEPNEYSLGESLNLSEHFDDLAHEKHWYADGYAIEKSAGFFNLDELKNATELAVRKIISELDNSINLTDFRFEKYHQFVSDDLHLKIIQKMRRLHPQHLSIDTDQILKKFSQYFGKNLVFKNPITEHEQWMIARINRPKSSDFNTAHKDIYEIFDKFQKIPQMINVWVPLIGVTKKNTLPIVPKSHLLPESKVMRTKAGATVNGIKYSVNSIKSWDDSSSLTQIPLAQDEILIFSSHLIHGLAMNHEEDITRVSFEFRLYVEA